MHQRIILAATLFLSLFFAQTSAGDCTRQGADAGMTKYCADNITADGELTLQYQKRFYGKWVGWDSTFTNYTYGNNVMIRDGQAVLLSNDQPNSDVNHVYATRFDWRSGQTQTNYALPGWNEWGQFSLRDEKHPREIDSHHYTNAVVWHSDGRIYAHRGGDHGCTGALDLQSGQWTKLPYIKAANGYSNWGGDRNGFLQSYGDQLIYRPGDTRNTGPYIGVDVSATAWSNGQQGTWKTNLGPYASSTSSPQYRYGDIPKVAQNICVLSALVYNNGYKVSVEASSMTTGALLWQRQFDSDSGGRRGFYTSVSDYWRFLATEDGHFAMFTRGQTPTVRMLDLQTGQDEWSLPMVNSSERPVMAYNGGSLYVIGRQNQYKIDAETVDVIWQRDNSFPNDRGYALRNHENGSSVTTDPLYRPVVLTDDTIWFVDGDSEGSAVLVGLDTSDGGIVRTIDLADLYTGDPGEELIVVNDLMAADGLIGVLVGVKDLNDPHPGNNGMNYQDLYVFESVPEPASVLLLACGAMILARKKSKR